MTIEVDIIDLPQNCNSECSLVLVARPFNARRSRKIDNLCHASAAGLILITSKDPACLGFLVRRRHANALAMFMLFAHRAPQADYSISHLIQARAWKSHIQRYLRRARCTMARLGQHPRARPEVSTHPSQKARLLGSGQIKVMIDHQLGHILGENPRNAGKPYITEPCSRVLPRRTDRIRSVALERLHHD